jgi:hypothetical protein
LQGPHAMDAARREVTRGRYGAWQKLRKHKKEI